MFLITLLIMLVAVVTLVLLVTSGSVARGIGNVFGLGDGFVLMLNIAKPPVMLVMVLLVLALLYYFTPNVKRPKFRWFSAGTLTALVILGLSLVGFGIYLSQFASYSATYGAIGGVIIWSSPAGSAISLCSWAHWWTSNLCVCVSYVLVCLRPRKYYCRYAMTPWSQSKNWPTTKISFKRKKFASGTAVTRF